jgi:hypothetical protein
MTFINFPSNPVLNQEFLAGTRKWIWNGVYWQAVSPSDRVGFTGSIGAGFVGSFGYIGSVGFVGSAGAGFTGSQGTEGFVGSSGFGFVGSAGIGFVGSASTAVGYSGSRGLAGTSVSIVGSVSTSALLPNPYTGNIGDGYITTDNGHLNVYNGVGWDDVGQIVGDDGPLGYTGSQGSGFVGSAGLGLDGYTGSQGAGFVGSAGANGTIGIDGYTGSQGGGFVGSFGYTGSAGINGINGTNGIDGESTFTWGETPPVDPAVGDRWYDTTRAKIVVWIDDGDSFQWVETSASGFLGRTGYTGSTTHRYITMAMPGDITPPFVGIARFYPPDNISINTIYANLSASPTSGNFNFDIKKNGVSINATCTMSTALMTPVEVSVSLTTEDYLTLDVSGSNASDLNVKLRYT